MVYTSSSIALSALEILANRTGELPDDYVSVSVDIPDDVRVVTVPEAALPFKWWSNPRLTEPRYCPDRFRDRKWKNEGPPSAPPSASCVPENKLAAGGSRAFAGTVFGNGNKLEPDGTPSAGTCPPASAAKLAKPSAVHTSEKFKSAGGAWNDILPPPLNTCGQFKLMTGSFPALQLRVENGGRLVSTYPRPWLSGENLNTNPPCRGSLLRSLSP